MTNTIQPDPVIAAIGLFALIAIGIVIALKSRGSWAVLLLAGILGPFAVGMGLLLVEELVFPGIGAAYGTNIDAALSALIQASVVGTSTYWAALIVGAVGVWFRQMKKGW
ncbi:hypothetical protein [Aliiroseovarius sp.]|uniref:hypothetical protein n=1 Tax=Aliiroseovarius sp. TaxID=1872442 RepID=UPI003BAC2BA3